MQAYLAPVFQLLFGLSLILFLVAAMRWRTPLHARGGHLMLVGLFLVPLALFFLSRGVGSYGDSARTALFIAGGVLMAAVLIQFLAIRKFVSAPGAIEGRN
ncbi:MAG: hypothetical protein ABTQ31_15475 [Rhizobiaceae bacterium]